MADRGSGRRQDLSRAGLRQEWVRRCKGTTSQPEGRVFEAFGLSGTCHVTHLTDVTASTLLTDLTSLTHLTHLIGLTDSTDSIISSCTSRSAFSRSQAPACHWPAGKRNDCCLV